MESDTGPTAPRGQAGEREEAVVKEHRAPPAIGGAGDGAAAEEPPRRPIRGVNGTLASGAEISVADLPESSSLYVGDLHPSVTEVMLYRMFSEIGPLNSIRICRDKVTRASLQYAYVNFINATDAVKAKETLNFEVLCGRPVRIMWSQRDPALRDSGIGNIVIRNLEVSIENRDLFNTFSTFGPILSSKVALDKEGRSKGYGFVHYQDVEAANLAISKVNGMTLCQEKLAVSQYKKIATVYIKNIPITITKECLKQMFGKFGSVVSVSLKPVESGRRRGFGFIAYDDPDAVTAACQALNGLEISGCRLFVCRALTKDELQARQANLEASMTPRRGPRNQGTNVYVKNLSDHFTENDLRREFGSFGTITSAKLEVTEFGLCKGFGFVNFSTRAEAADAIREMNGRIVGEKPLYVGQAMKKEERREQLENKRLHQMMMSTFEQLEGMPDDESGSVRGNPEAKNRAGPSHGIRSGPPRTPFIPGPVRTNGSESATFIAHSNFIREVGRELGSQVHVGKDPHARGLNTSGPQRRTDGEPVVFSEPEPKKRETRTSLNLVSSLVEADPQEAKKMLFSHLLPLVEAKNNGDAMKITTMLMEMDPAEILHMLEDDESLTERVEEALALLSYFN